MKGIDTGIAKISMENLETGEVDEFEHYLFAGGFQMETVILVRKVESYDLPDNSFQISVTCMALDAHGSVFNLDVQFTPKTVEERKRILGDFQSGAIHYVKGQYAIVPEHKSIMLFKPVCSPIPAHTSEEELREVFRFNSTEKERSVGKADA